jgi:hypothetical protein
VLCEHDGSLQRSILVASQVISETLSNLQALRDKVSLIGLGVARLASLGAGPPFAKQHVWMQTSIWESPSSRVPVNGHWEMALAQLS